MKKPFGMQHPLTFGGDFVICRERQLHRIVCESALLHKMMSCSPSLSCLAQAHALYGGSVITWNVFNPHPEMSLILFYALSLSLSVFWNRIFNSFGTIAWIYSAYYKLALFLIARNKCPNNQIMDHSMLTSTLQQVVAVQKWQRSGCWAILFLWTQGESVCQL